MPAQNFTYVTETKRAPHRPVYIVSAATVTNPGVPHKILAFNTRTEPAYNPTC
jgi:hypothetical protein